MTAYLITTYIMGMILMVTAYGFAKKLIVADFLMFIMSPWTVPVTLVTKLVSHAVDLKATVYK